MGYRKLISFGKNSYVISLPKQWIKDCNLKKGDLIHVEESSDSLIVSPQSSEAKTEDKELTIYVDGKDIKQIKREIIGGYIRNNTTIILKGDSIKENAMVLQSVIQGLIALEVMEQTTKMIVAKDFLNIEGVSTKSVIRKMDIITRSMLSDCEKMFEEDNYENINYRDNDVNKLTFLIYRIVRFGLDNTFYMKKTFDLTPLNLLTLWGLAYDIESVADEAKRIARYLQRMSLNKKQQKEFLKILTEIRKSYLKMMKAFYDGDLVLVHEVFVRKSEIVKMCDEFYLKHRPVQWVGFLIERTKGAIGHISHIGRVIYHGDIVDMKQG